jgi:MFS family permease
MSAQIIGGIGVSAGIAVGALLAEDLSGSTAYAGLGGTLQVLGTAALAIPMARIMDDHGRRPGLMFGYACALLGAVGLILSAVIGSFPLLLVASAFFGGASSSSSQSGFAAADLAAPHQRGRDLGLVVWATTIGAVLGPNLVGPSEPVARALGIPLLAGPFAFSAVALAVTVLLLHLRLRPDPLLESRRRADEANADAAAPGTRSRGSIRAGLAIARRHPDAALGLATVALGHAVMVSVMVMTPLHMRHGDASLRVIGFVISLHIVGMFAFSPIVGVAVDRLGGRAVALIGSAVLCAATIAASLTATGESWLLTLALFLLGLGWSCTLVSGSTLLTNATTPAERPSVQGASTMLMGLAGGGGGAFAGLVVETWSFAVLALGSLCIAVGGGLAALLMPRDRARSLVA